MKSFLEQVASYYNKEGKNVNYGFIFPNRRSLMFFRAELSKLVAVEHKVSWVPELFTIGDFFAKISNTEVADRVTLLLELYNCYSSLYKNIETLDNFISWGDILIADFNDVDKYNANVKGIFANVSDFKEIQADYGFLEGEQKEAMEKFLHLLGTNITKDEAKIKYKALWEILYPLYIKFNKALEDKNLAYDGMVYRKLADRLKTENIKDIITEHFTADKFVFVGLNALNECERLVLKKMKDALLAEFMWDYCSSFIKDHQNKSSFFLKDNVLSFPNAFELEYDNNHIPNVNVINIPSSVGQVKLLPNILQTIANNKYNGNLANIDKDTAVVLPDEALLPFVLNTIPQEIKKINVTMGCGMQGSECFSFIMDLINCQLNIYCKNGEVYFYYQNVASIFFNSVFRNALSQEDIKVVESIKNNKMPYIPINDVNKTELLSIIFTQVITDNHSNDKMQIERLSKYLLTIVSKFAPLLKNNVNLVNEIDYAMKCYLCINTLYSKNLAIKPGTYKQLLFRLLSGYDVHFKGEPLMGLQIMGPLETRALDFSNVIIFSCNEDMFPRKNIASSFIPAQIRKSFGLPTYEFQDAVWAYYFYRLLQRTYNIWLVVDARHSFECGEESRYIKQLEYHFGVKVNRYNATAKIQNKPEVQCIKKPENIEQIIKNMKLSSTAIQTYLTCGAQFYYAKILKLTTDDEVLDSLEANNLGNVFHAIMQACYLDEGFIALSPGFSLNKENIQKAITNGVITPLKKVTKQRLHKLIAEIDGLIANKVRSILMEELKLKTVKGFNLLTEKIILEYVKETLKADLQLLGSKDSFDILGLETQGHWHINGFHLYGYIDRLDSFQEGEVRVVDYKTGAVKDEEISFDGDYDPENPTSKSSKTFITKIKNMFPHNNKLEYKILLQMFLYDRFVRAFPHIDPNAKLINSVYAICKISSYGVQGMEEKPNFTKLIYEKLMETLEEMVNPNIPFMKTDNKEICTYCKFQEVCGKC